MRRASSGSGDSRKRNASRWANCGCADQSGLAMRMSRAVNSGRSEEHTSELQSLMRISYAVFCLKKKIVECSIPTLHLSDSILFIKQATDQCIKNRYRHTC